MSVDEVLSAVEIVSGALTSVFGLVLKLAETSWVSVAELPDESVADHVTVEVPNGKPSTGASFTIKGELSTASLA